MKSCFYLFVMMYFSCIQIFAQTLNLIGDVEDEFLQKPINNVRITVMNPDSTVVTDSVRYTFMRNGKGELLAIQYAIPVPREKRDYLLRASRDGYDDVWQSISVLFPDKVNAVEVPTFKMRRNMGGELKEVTVTATKIKMYHKGDTLVFNADAFQLPDGSMLDALIRQLPGVTMNDDGQIFVNGRLVEELLLGSRSFMRGNKKVLMENLPYYTVKDLKVYEKQTDKSEVLGYDVENRKYVMDVNLKDAYSQGYIANVEAAGGTDKRWLGRGFLLGFDDLWRYSVMANSNNVNESRHIGEQNHWSPDRMPRSLVTTHSLATDLDYQSKDKNTKNNFTADFTSTAGRMEMSQQQELFLEGLRPTSLSANRNKNSDLRFSVKNSLTVKKPTLISSETDFNYSKQHGTGFSQYDQWDLSKTASMHSDLMSEGRSWTILQQLNGAFNLNKEKQSNITWYTLFRHGDTKSWLSTKYDTWQATSPINNIRYNANDVSNRLTNALGYLYATLPDLLGKINLVLGDHFQYSHAKAHDYLYHPDTLQLASQLDMLTAITDVSNSYDSDQRMYDNSFSAELTQRATYELSGGVYRIHYDRWKLGISVPLRYQKLDYHRGMVDTLAHNTALYVQPHVAYRYMSPDGNHDLRINASHDRSPLELLELISYKDDSQPLVVKLGNPDLQGKATTNLSATYSLKYGKRQKQWHIGSAFKYKHRDVAESVTYNQKTGVYTYKPMNVSGAYDFKADFNYSQAIDDKRYWTWQTNFDVQYIHDIDHTMFAGDTQSHENIVNTTTLHDNAYIQYNKGQFYVRATGDIRWRHSEGLMLDFKSLNTLDYQYGLSARYTIPVLKTTISADANMYSRRGYGSTELNTDDFVLNASLSQPLLKGKLIARIEAFDLLHQLSQTQYAVNAQGRTVTWYRSLPNYVMLHLVYHWNKNPKKL